MRYHGAMKPPQNNKPPAQADAEDDEVLAQAMADLAQSVASADTPALREQLTKDIRNALRKRNDDLLYGAIECARSGALPAYRLLREQIEEAAATYVIRRDGAPPEEIDAFLVPVFVHSHGGLDQAATFQDDAAFAELVDSFAQAGLESAQAKIVLISHAYALNEIDAITYSQLGEMLREAAASMNERKITPTPALERSIGAWPAHTFGADDEAMELRFLLGFSRKRADDPFYQPPQDEAAADAWYEARMERYRAWTERAAPLVQRCLARQPDAVHLSFLYRDLFFSAKEQGLAELEMLALMADINAALAEQQLDPEAVRAVTGPADVEDEMVMRVNLVKKADQSLLLSCDKPLDAAADWQAEVDDICDALATIGIVTISVARQLGADGKAIDERPYLS